MSIVRNRLPCLNKSFIKTLHPEVRKIWLTQDEELPELPELPLSLDSTVGNDPAVNKEKEEYLKNLWSWIDILTENEKKVLIMKLEDDMTLQDIAQSLDLSRQRIKQIETMAYRRVGWFFNDENTKLNPRKNIYNRSVPGENILNDSVLKIPETFYSVYTFMYPAIVIEEYLCQIRDVFRDRFLDEYSPALLTTNLSLNDHRRHIFVFVISSDSFLAKCADELLEKELVKYKLGYKRMAYNQP